jgi:CheY-like chemotaxis protein
MDLPFETEDGEGGAGGTLASTVLVVDDEPVVLDICARLLEREPDLVVTLAQTAEEALPLLQEQRFDVLVTDKNLPGLDGIELIAAARKLQPNLEALMITAYASSESVIAAFAAGASDYILKPFDDLRVLRAKVRAALERHTIGARVREQAREVAREAALLLARGHDAPEPAHVALEDELRAYEEAARQGVRGQVAVIGSPRAVAMLSDAGFDSRELEPDAPELEAMDVVIVETSHPQWRALAERLERRPPDVLLLASPQADLGDLLEAITLRMELVGFGSTEAASALPDKVRMHLLRRGVERAQNRLALALATFRQSIPPPLR